MVQVSRGSWVITLAGELCLFSAVIMWVDLVKAGVSSLGLLLPVTLTLLGVFCFGRGIERAGSEARGAHSRRQGDTLRPAAGRTV
jgi:hypothetical protein